MGAYPRLAYIRYTRARVRRLAVVVAGMAAVAAVRLVAWRSWRCVWWRRRGRGAVGLGRWRSPLDGAADRTHMILLYQFVQETRNIARLCRMSSRAKSPKIG